MTVWCYAHRVSLSHLEARDKGPREQVDPIATAELAGFLEVLLTVKAAARFLSLCPSLLYSYVERK